MKKLIFSVLLLIPLFFSCNRKPVIIRYWTQETEPYVKSAETLVSKFNQSQNRISVRLEYFPFAKKINERILAAFDDQSEPDVMLFYGATHMLAKKKLLLPVSDDVYSEKELNEKIYSAALKNRIYGNQIYGLPLELNIESPGLLVNKTLLEQAGESVPAEWIANNGPKTWEEVIILAKKLTVIKNSQIERMGIGIFNRQEESMFLSLIWQLGGDYRDENNSQVHFNTKEGREALLFMKRLITGPERVSEYQVNSALKLLATNKAVMSVGAPWYGPVVEEQKDSEFLYFNLPPFIPGSKPYFVSEGGWGLIVSARTQYPEESWKFVKYLYQAENMGYWAETVGSVSADREFGKTAEIRSESMKKYIVPALDVLQYGEDPGAYTEDTFKLVWQIVRHNLRGYLLGNLSMDEALANMDREGNAMISSNLSGDNEDE